MSEEGTDAGTEMPRSGEGDVVIPPGAAQSAEPAAPSSRDGLVSAAEKGIVGDELKGDYERRIMRRVAFALFAILSISFFALLIQFLSVLVADPKILPALIGAVHSPHAAFVISLLILVSATVPLSLAFALIKISAERERTADRDGLTLSDLSPPVVRVVQGLVDLAKAASPLK